MGRNLDRLMQSYGVYTPTVSAYSGVATPDALKAGATAGERGTYQGALADYAAQQDAFKGYETDYKNRIANTNLYTSPGPASTFLSTPNYSDITGMRANLSDTTSADATDYTNPDFSSMINDAYRSLGRVGIGTDTGNIDQPGYNYWMGQLQAGANGGIAPRDFKNQFKIATNDYIKQKPDDDYTKYIQGYLGILPPKAMTLVDEPTGNTPDEYEPGNGGNGGGGEGGGGGSGMEPAGAAGDTMAQISALGDFLSGLGGQQPTADYMADVNSGGYGEDDGGSAPASGPGTGTDNAYASGGRVRSPTSMEEAIFRDRSRHKFPEPGFEELYGKYFYDRGGIVNLGNLPDIYPPSENTTAPTVDAPVNAASEDASEGGSDSGFGGGTPAPIEAAPPPVDPQEALYNQYFQRQPESNAVIAARKNVDDNRAALLKIIQDHSDKSEENRPSKAEMYFRLAAAFGAPTKTGKGGFMESVSLASKELGEFEKSTTDAKRASSAKKLQMQLETNKITLQAAREGLADLQIKDSQDNANRKAFGLKLFDAQQERNKPTTEAEKRAISLGYTRGTPEYRKYIDEQEAIRVGIESKANKPKASTDIGKRLTELGFIPGTLEFIAEYKRLVALDDENANKPKASTDIGKRLTELGFIPGTLEFIAEYKRLVALDDAKAGTAAVAAKQKLTALSPYEMRIRTVAEDALVKIDQSIKDLRRAYAINKLTYKGTPAELIQMGVKELVGSDDPIVIYTREQQNLLASQALNALKELFPGAISDGERHAIMRLQGIGSKSLKERGVIITRAYEALLVSAARNRDRIGRINSGYFRQTVNPEGGSSDGE